MKTTDLRGAHRLCGLWRDQCTDDPTRGYLRGELPEGARILVIANRAPGNDNPSAPSHWLAVMGPPRTKAEIDYESQKPGPQSAWRDDPRDSGFDPEEAPL